MTPSFDREVVSHRDTPPCAELVSWREAYGLVAGITTRGASQESFKLGPETPEGSTAADPWSRLVSTFSPAFAGVAVSRQPHGTKVREHESGVEGWLRLDGYDGHVTLEAGLLLTVTVADCVPVYLADPGTGGIALLHAGWRGIAAGVLEEGIERLAALTGRPRDCFVMHAGVAIGGTQYEVGPEVVGPRFAAAARAPAGRSTRCTGPARRGRRCSSHHGQSLVHLPRRRPVSLPSPRRSGGRSNGRISRPPFDLTMFRT